jgi:chemotaxis methyl-accepting protein methylase
MLFMKGVDLIFCCNVLIYFDAALKAKCSVICLATLILAVSCFSGLRNP